jgi:cytochrome c-type biogenesis protein
MSSLFFLAIGAGLLTVLAPCILPILPILLGTGGGRSRWRPIAIIGGFIGSFSLVGAAFATAGSFLGVSNDAFRLVAVVFLLVFGCALLFEDIYDRAMVRLQPLFARLGAKVSGGSVTRTDALSGIAVGVSLGLIWTPCAGPILGSILTLLLMFAYAVGAGVPMLAIAYGGGAVRSRLQGVGRWKRVLDRVFGALIVITALLILTGYDLALQAWLIRFYPTGFTGLL